MATKGDIKVELWYRGTTKIGNIRQLCKRLHWTKQRNGLDTVEFSMELQRFEEWCAARGENPNNVLKPLAVDVRVKVRGTYIVGATIIDRPPNFNQSNATVQVTCDGFLALLNRRRLTKTYTSQYTGNIVKDAIDTIQAETNGNLGITFDPSSYLGNSGTRKDTYVDKKVGEILVDRSKYVTDGYDFKFFPDRTLKLYAYLGNDRTADMVVYPADAHEGIPATSMTMTSTGEPVANRIIAIGAGSGDAAPRYIANDLLSQVDVGIIEDTLILSDVADVTTLQFHAEAELAKRKALLEQPKPQVNGSYFKTDVYDVGDVITIKQSSYSTFAYNNAVRIEMIECDVSEEDNEDITLTVDAETV